MDLAFERDFVPTFRPFDLELGADAVGGGYVDAVAVAPLAALDSFRVLPALALASVEADTTGFGATGATLIRVFIGLKSIDQLLTGAPSPLSILATVFQ